VRPLFLPVAWRRNVKRMATGNKDGKNASEWQMSVFDDEKSPQGMRIGVRTISELKTGAKRLVDGIYFDGLDILRCYEGHFRFSFKDRPVVDLLPGETLVTYPRHIVTIDALDKSNRIVYGVFEGPDVESYFDSLGFFDCAKGRTDAHLDSIKELDRQLKVPHEKGDAQWGKCLSLLTDILRTQAMEMRRHGNALVFDAVRTIHKNLQNRIANVKELCNQLGISRVHLHRLFVDAGLGSPSDFIREKQMHYVRDLLENTDLPLSEVAERAGFLSSAHFTTFVKRMTQLTPTQIRQGRMT